MREKRKKNRRRKERVSFWGAIGRPLNERKRKTSYPAPLNSESILSDTSSKMHGSM